VISALIRTPVLTALRLIIFMIGHVFPHARMAPIQELTLRVSHVWWSIVSAVQAQRAVVASRATLPRWTLLGRLFNSVRLIVGTTTLKMDLSAPLV
jgi:hypothetical protein